MIRRLLARRTRAFAESPNVARASKIQCHRSSVAAAASSAPPDSSSEVKRARKRVSKDERRNMVELFVNKYRAMNCGKFPTASDAKKEVGGSYYLVRKVIQELQYESQMSSTSMRKESQVKIDIDKKAEIPTNFEDVLTGQTAVETDIFTDTGETVKSSVENREFTGHKSSSIAVLVSSSQMKDELDILDNVNWGNDETAIRKERARESEATEAEVPSVAQTISEREARENYTSGFKSSGGTQAVQENDMSTEVEPVSSAQMTCAEVDNRTSYITDAYTSDVSDKHIKEETSFNELGSSSATGDNCEAVASQSNLLNEEPEYLHSSPELSGDRIEEETNSTDVLEHDAMKSKDNELEQSPEPEKFTRDTSKEQADDESPKESFTWKRLKSLADGILNMWRKL